MDEELQQAGETLGLHAAIAMLYASQDRLKVEALGTLGRALLEDLHAKTDGRPDPYELTVVTEAVKSLQSIGVLARAIQDGAIKGAPLGGA